MKNTVAICDNCGKQCSHLYRFAFIMDRAFSLGGYGWSAAGVFLGVLNLFKMTSWRESCFSIDRDGKIPCDGYAELCKDCSDALEKHVREFFAQAKAKEESI